MGHDNRDLADMNTQIIMYKYSFSQCEKKFS